MTHTVTLEPEEMSCAKLVGALRFDASKNLKDKWGATKDEASDVESAAAEVAFAKWRQMYWPGKVNRASSSTVDFKAPDVGWFQVRHTVHEHGCLRLTKEDSDTDPFVLVTGRNGKYTVRGWLYGHEGKQPQWWGDWPEPKRPPAFWVKQNALRSADSLRSWAPDDADAFIAKAKLAFPGSREVEA